MRNLTLIKCKLWFELQVKKHFSRYVSNDAQEGEVWFDSNGLPLKWHFPIGWLSSICFQLRYLSSTFLRQNVIFLFSGVLFEMTKREDELPWCITIHFSKFPDDVLFRCPNR